MADYRVRSIPSWFAFVSLTRVGSRTTLLDCERLPYAAPRASRSENGGTDLSRFRPDAFLWRSYDVRPLESVFLRRGGAYRRENASICERLSSTACSSTQRVPITLQPNDTGTLRDDRDPDFDEQSLCGRTSAGERGIAG